MKVRSLAQSFIIVWLLVGLSGGSTSAWASDKSAADNPIILLRLNKTVVQAEVVFTPEKLYLGLGGRQQLPPGSGMLFIMPNLEVQEFCMRGMLIPIDIIWLAQDRVIGFHQNLSPNDSGYFQSPGPADLVLEVPAGFVASAGLQIGDRLQHL
jgi:uncharacterized membrane protein (UPF0127 family)